MNNLKLTTLLSLIVICSASFIIATSQAHAEDFKTLLKNADAEKGKKIFRKCKACHTTDENGKNKIGPNLWNIVNRKIGSVAEFKYSKAMANKEGVWTVEELNNFLKSPRAYIKGTKMTFAGVKKPKQIAHVIAYLETLRTKD